MTKAVSLSLGFLLLFAFGLTAPAQPVAPVTSGITPEQLAIQKAIEDQANTIVLRQKLAEAKAAETRGDLLGAAKLYDTAYGLTQQIGPGIEAETAQTIAGLAAVRMDLARQAEANGDYLEANTQVTRVLRVDPHNPAALEFKQKNDAYLEATKGQRPDVPTLEQVPLIKQQKQDAGTLVQDGKLLYEAGKFEEAQVKLQQALKLDPDNQAAFYYLNLVKQAFYAREENNRTTETQDKMLLVQKEWVPPVGTGLPVPNPYATNTDIHTSAQREKIFDKLSRIRLDNISWTDGLPLSEVMSFLRDQSQKRDPEQKGVNFLFNPNQESSGITGAEAGGGAGAATRINPQTGLAEAVPGGGGAGGGETVDPSSITIKLALSDVTLQEALDAIVLVADRPIKYSVGDYGVIFSTKPSGPEPPELEMRTFRVDPNTFYQGLQSVTTFTFGAANNNSGGGGSGGSGNSGGSGGNSGGGGNGSSVSGAIVPVVDIAGGGGGNGGNGGGNGGGRGGGGGGGGGNAGGGGGNAGGGNGNGINYLTAPGNMSDVSTAARDFFNAIGVFPADAPGRSVAFNDRLGLLFVKALPSELDAIERTIHALNQVAPQVHIKARFIEVSQDDSASLGFDWYLGNFINGSVVANGGSAPSLTVPVSAANPLGAFPGNTLASLIPPSATDQQLTAGLRNSAPALATVTGILTDPNFRVVIRALQQRSGVETLAEPEVVTTSGRQTQMRATDIEYILTGFNTSQAVGGVGTATGQ